MPSRMIGTEVSIVVMGLGLGRTPGRVLDLDLPAFQRLCELERGCHSRLCALDQTLRQLAALNVLPPTLRILVVDCVRTDEGIGLTGAVKAAIRPAVRRIGLILEKANVHTARPPGDNVLPLYRLSALREVI